MRSLHDALSGATLGTAVGDALGLPAEGLSPPAIARRFGALERFALLGRTGFVSDDTEQSLLVLQSLLARGDAETTAARFRHSLVGWFWRLPFGVGLATLRACLRATFGLSRSGVSSAGNGAAMRSPVLGVFLRDAPDARVTGFARALAQVTHTDARAVDGAAFAALFAAHLARGEGATESASSAIASVTNEELRRALESAVTFAASGTPELDCAQRLGTSGFVVHSVPWALCCALRHADAPMEAVRMAIRHGGDTDTNAAMVGAWLGARHGPEVFPPGLVAALAGGPFGVAHARRLVDAAVSNSPELPGYAWPLALLRNVALFPVVLAHGFRRLLPW